MFEFETVRALVVDSLEASDEKFLSGVFDFQPFNTGSMSVQEIRQELDASRERRSVVIANLCDRTRHWLDNLNDLFVKYFIGCDAYEIHSLKHGFVSAGILKVRESD